MFSETYTGRRVLVTGHTGFKGSWLTSWLLNLGAEVAGFSNGLPSLPSNFEVLALEKRIRHFVGDVTDAKRLAEVIDEFRPEIIFHLAAQALVRRSYKDPVTTFTTNAIGTLNVLDCVRQRPHVRALVLITSDKCYQNVEWIWGYRENDRLGGDDPYSASKACAEIVAHSFLKSYFKLDSGLAAVATARAGNVIGGGDWAEDRIVPDCMRCWSVGKPVIVRSPQSTRPWQHVLEPLSGYLKLGAELWVRNPAVVGQAYNFGPDSTVNHPVSQLIREIGKYWEGAKWEFAASDQAKVHEAGLLKLCCDKALAELDWRPTLAFSSTVSFTGEWYRRYYLQQGGNMYGFANDQIDQYCSLARDAKIAWTQ